MNTDQLQCIIGESKCLSAYVKGIFSPDTLPLHVTLYPSAYICNTDPSYLPGRHWVVFWFSNESQAEFYDSLGHGPEHNDPRFSTFLKNNAVSFRYNDVSLQHMHATTCGYHVLFYLLMKCKHKQMQDIVRLLKSKQSPDRYVYQYMRERFDCL